MCSLSFLLVFCNSVSEVSPGPVADEVLNDEQKNNDFGPYARYKKDETKDIGDNKNDQMAYIIGNQDSNPCKAKNINQEIDENNLLDELIKINQDQSIFFCFAIFSHGTGY